MASTITKTILIVDDEEDILHVLEQAAKKAGFLVHSFTDPEAALEHIKNGCAHCELLITDIKMPGINGFELVRSVRKYRPDLKVIMMTALEVNKPEFEVVFPSMKVEDVIRKPFSPSKLIELVKVIYPLEAKQ